MSVLSLVWGILALVGMIVAFFPCLGSLNWLNIPFAGIGLIISIIAMNSAPESDRGKAIAGVVLCGIAVILGTFRLIAGGGVV
ncbi:hypothetical protein MASR1M107_02360 [Ignavibacteriales bacterium]